jgi:hypothetical protein
MARSKDILSLKKNRVDEEFYPLLDHLKQHPDFATFTEQQKLAHIRSYYN